MADFAGSGLLLAHPGAGPFVQEVARALYEAGLLERFATTLLDRPDAAWRRVLATVPIVGPRADRELRRRRVPSWLWARSAMFPLPELARVLASRLDRSGSIAHRIWEMSEPAFDRWVARHQLDGVRGVYGYEHAALQTFRQACRRGLFVALDLPSLAQEHVARIFERELARWPELVSPYTQKLAEQRSLRAAAVREQIELASCVIANSVVTLRSYVEQGYAMSHAIAIPLAAPPTIDERELRGAPAGPLRLLFAGTLGVQKGGHYLLEAFARLPRAASAELTVCGQLTLPETFVAPRARGVSLRGHLPSDELRRAYLEHDALILPTLSDGFGLVVTEALAHGLPVITTDQCGASQLIVHGKNGLITPAADVDALFEALSFCVRERDALHAMRAAALATARERPWSRYRRELQDALRAGLAAHEDRVR